MSRSVDTWLRDRLEEGNVPGLNWTDKHRRQFRLPGKHLGRRDVRKSDDAVYKVYIINYRISFNKIHKIRSCNNVIDDSMQPRTQHLLSHDDAPVDEALYVKTTRHPQNANPEVQCSALSSQEDRATATGKLVQKIS